MTGTCAIPGCGKPHRARGWCKAHYSKWYRHGDPLHSYKGNSRKKIDLTGRRFGGLVVIGEAPQIGGDSTSRVRCDCGTIKAVRTKDLRRGSTRSCGCSTNVRHGARVGGSKTPEYRSYDAMRQRCLNPNRRGYKDYGGRGITICDRWLEGFENFLADMGPKPSPAHSIDRTDNDGPYSPQNCRWQTPKEQNRNTRVVRPVERSDGKIYQSTREAAEDVGGSPSTISEACRNPGKEWRGFTWRYVEADAEDRT